VIKRFFNRRRLLLGFGAALLAGLIWWFSQPTIVGIWTGRTPPALCNGSMNALRLTSGKEWKAQSYDYGCLGSYRILDGTPPIIEFGGAAGRTAPTFAYTVTDDLLVLQNATGTYTLTQCDKSIFACAGN